MRVHRQLQQWQHVVPQECHLRHHKTWKRFEVCFEPVKNWKRLLEILRKSNLPNQHYHPRRERNVFNLWLRKYLQQDEEHTAQQLHCYLSCLPSRPNHFQRNQRKTHSQREHEKCVWLKKYLPRDEEHTVRSVRAPRNFNHFTFFYYVTQITRIRSVISQEKITRKARLSMIVMTRLQVRKLPCCRSCLWNHLWNCRKQIHLVWRKNITT